MGYDTDFYGKLEFTRELTTGELALLDGILSAARRGSEEISDALHQQAEADRAIRGGDGPLIFDPNAGANLRAAMEDFVTGDGLSPHNASALRISDDKSGLVYCSEKTYDMIGGVNFIIANGRAKIPGFGLKGHLFAETEFEPHQWLVAINDEGWAEQVPCKRKDLPLTEQRMIADEKERQSQAWAAMCAELKATSPSRKRGFFRRLLGL